MGYHIEFVSPETSPYSGEAESVIARTRGGGELGFLDGHEPFIGSLEPCIIKVSETSGDEKFFAVRGGFVSVTPQSGVTVLSDAVVTKEELPERGVLEKELEVAQSALEEDPTDPYLRDDVSWANLRIKLAS